MLYEQLNALSGIEFEHLCATIVSNMGFQIEMTKASGDGGIDIIAINDMPLYSGKYIIQCKRYSGTVGEPVLRDLYGVVVSERANKGILMTTGTFTRNALTFAEGKPLELIDMHGIQALLNQGDFEAFTQKEHIKQDSLRSIIEQNFGEYTFDDLLSQHLNNPTDSHNRCKLGHFLFSHGTDDIANYSPEQRFHLLHASTHFLDPLRKRDINKISDKSEQAYLFACLWICAQSAFLSGNFEVAEDCYNQMLSWDDLIKSINDGGILLQYLFQVILDIVIFYSLMGQHEKANQILLHPRYSEIINARKIALKHSIQNAPNPQGANYCNLLLKDIENWPNIKYYHLLQLNERVFFGAVPLYDKALKTYQDFISTVREQLSVVTAQDSKSFSLLAYGGTPIIQVRKAPNEYL